MDIHRCKELQDLEKMKGCSITLEAEEEQYVMNYRTWLTEKVIADGEHRQEDADISIAIKFCPYCGEKLLTAS